jgi:hypothetical protein
MALLPRIYGRFSLLISAPVSIVVPQDSGRQVANALSVAAAATEQVETLRGQLAAQEEVSPPARGFLG